MNQAQTKAQQQQQQRSVNGSSSDRTSMNQSPEGNAAHK